MSQSWRYFWVMMLAFSIGIAMGWIIAYRSLNDESFWQMYYDIPRMVPVG